MEIFIELFLIVTALAVVLNVIFKAFDIPTIIGYIIAGICLSQMANITHTKIIHAEEIVHVAEFGVVFLMFTIGLEFSFKHLMSMKKEVFFNGFLQMSACGIVFSMLIENFFDINIKTAVIIGFALALSSTAIVLKILNDTKDINQNYGRKALGILLFQDLAVIPILLMIDIFASADNTPVNSLIFKTAISAAIVLLLLFVLGKFVFNKVLYFVVKTESKETFIATILFIVVGASFLAHIFGFSYTLGAFIAGMLIAETEYKHQMEADLIPFRDILLGLFFITIGMQINFDTILNHYGMILVLIVLTMAIKTGVVYAILILASKKRVALKAALSICQIGEFALAIFAILISRKMISGELGQILITVVVVTMILTPFILKNLSRLANRIESEVEGLDEEAGFNLSNLKNHIIVAGYGRIGQEVVRRLQSGGLEYVVIDSDVELVHLGQSRGEKIYFGNLTQKSTLDALNIKEASAIILTISNEQKLELVAKTINALNLKADVIIRYTGIDRKKELVGEFGENFVFIKEERAVANALINEALQSRMSKI